jgi:CDP-4-dehydro-6-deoxyglucose reductase
MPRYLTLSRAARLVGVRRGALQAKIRSGELAAFEGMVAEEDLLRAFPQARLEDNSVLERLEAIKEAAFARRVRERVLPSAEALMARLAELEHYRAIVVELQERLRAPGGTAELLEWLQERLAPAAPGGRPLLAQDSLLRIMSAHVRVQPSGREFFVDGSDSLLEAALRAGLSLDYGCSIGTCGKCKARVISGQVQRMRHSDYAPTAAEKTAGVMLMCCHTALTDLVIEAREAHGAADMPLQTLEARIKSVTPMGADMRLLHLQTPRTQRLRFLAGQSVRLSLGEDAGASLPVASCPCDERNLQFHVRRQPGDAFAERVFAGLKGVDAVRVEGPRGEFVLDESSARPLVFIAFDTGFAPVKSLIEHAMALDAADTLQLVWVATAGGAHYLDNQCRAWSDALDDFRYDAPATAPGASAEEIAQAALRPVLQAHARLQEVDAYVAGPAAPAQAAEFLLLEHGLPRAQLRLSAAQV